MPKNNKITRNRWFYFIQLLFDVSIIDISYYLGFRIQRPELFTNGTPIEVLIPLMYIAFISLVFIVSFKVYKGGKERYSVTAFYLLLSLPLIAFVSVFADFLIKGIGVWRRTIFYAILIQAPILLLIKLMFYKLHKFCVKLPQTIIVGESIQDCMNLYTKLIDNKGRIYDIKCLVAEENEKLKEYLSESRQVIISSECEHKTKIIEFCALNYIDCTIVPGYSEVLVNSGKFENVDDIMFCDMKVKMDIEARILKRTMDLLISTIALIILLPVMAVVSVLIKIYDKGKIIYSQTRVTRGNKKFTLYKFRTMVENAEKDTGAVLAQLDDNRITKLGRFLRKTRIDEIPQLYNVLKGEMSIVGPRPERPEIIGETIKRIPEYGYRTLVKAGITGLAQTLGRYDTKFDDKLRFDLYYVTNYSPVLDLKIIFYTLHTIIRPSVANGLIREEENADIFKIFKDNGIEYEQTDGCVFIKK